jgi:putative heme transporter
MPRRVWIRRPGQPNGAPPAGDFEPRDLIGLFTAPRWLREFGVSAWLAVGVTLFLVALVSLLALTETIVIPVITAAVIASVASPLIRWLEARGVARGFGAALFLLALIVLSVVVVMVVLVGIASEFDALRRQLEAAKDTIAGWATDLGVDPGTAETAKEDASSTLGDAVPALLNGLGEGVRGLSSLVVFLAFTLLSTFFLLKDGPQIRHWIEGHLRVPRRSARGMTQRVLQSLRGYFVGVTAVALFNAVVVGAGALLLGVPLAGSIAAITFIGAYVPYLGAWGAGVFSVLIALGGAGADAAAGMIVIQLLANGILQQMIQPIAYGAALGIHPLAVLIVTIAGGSLFGAVGLILAAPLTAAATRIAADMAAAREPEPEASSPPGSEPAPVT